MIFHVIANPGFGILICFINLDVGLLWTHAIIVCNQFEQQINIQMLPIYKYEFGGIDK